MVMLNVKGGSEEQMAPSSYVVNGAIHSVPHWWMELWMHVFWACSPLPSLRRGAAGTWCLPAPGPLLLISTSLMSFTCRLPTHLHSCSRPSHLQKSGFPCPCPYSSLPTLALHGGMSEAWSVLAASMASLSISSSSASARASASPAH